MVKRETSERDRVSLNLNGMMESFKIEIESRAPGEQFMNIQVAFGPSVFLDKSLPKFDPVLSACQALSAFSTQFPSGLQSYELFSPVPTGPSIQVHSSTRV